MESKEKLALKAGWLSISGNILLFVIKYWAGISSFSVALIADAWHTLSDSISSVIVLMGVKISKKDKNNNRPFGYGRAEWIASLIVGVLLSIVAFEFLTDSIDKLSYKEEARYGTLAIVVTIISVIAKELMAQYSFYAGKVTKMRSLKADAWHHRSDAISSVVILVGIFIGKFFWWVDGVLGILVSLLLFFTSYEILKESISPLIGEEPDEKLTSKINHYAKECFSRDMNIHHIHSHTYGDHVELTFHMVFPKNTTLEEAHNDATRLENKLYEELGIYATIHMEPEDDSEDLTNLP